VRNWNAVTADNGGGGYMEYLLAAIRELDTEAVSFHGVVLN
jgi:hypothetical protein